MLRHAVVIRCSLALLLQLQPGLALSAFVILARSTTGNLPLRFLAWAVVSYVAAHETTEAPLSQHEAALCRMVLSS